MGLKVKAKSKKGKETNQKLEEESQRNIPQFSKFGAVAVSILAIIIMPYFHAGSIDSESFQEWFASHGGWMIPSLKLEKTEEYGNTLRLTKSITDDARISHKDKLIEIPTSIVFTKEKASKKVESIVSTQIYNEVLKVIQKQLPNNVLEQQDTWIAVDLMLECSLGLRSNWYPYLQVLPKIQSRLSSFNDKEFDFLQDDSLATLGRNQRKAYTSIWNGGVHRCLKEAASISPEATKCLTLDNFHNYISLVASRAMILNHESEYPTKYLTPMADMINHADIPEERLDSGSNFHNYHRYQKESQSIIVYADRQFRVGDSIVEEYGKLDNSLYLTVFGFIPQNNPNHCVMLFAPYHSAEECVHRDGTILNNNELEKALVLHLLSPELCNTKEECWIHPDRKRSLQSYWRPVARSRLDQSSTTLEDDKVLLKNLEESIVEDASSTSLWRGMNRDHARLALTFRIEEKKLLTHLAR